MPAPMIPLITSSQTPRPDSCLASGSGVPGTAPGVRVTGTDLRTLTLACESEPVADRHQAQIDPVVVVQVLVEVAQRDGVGLGVFGDLLLGDDLGFRRRHFVAPRRSLVQSDHAQEPSVRVACEEAVDARRQLQNLDQRCEYWESKANLAVSKGRDDLAREALLEKRRYSRRAESLTGELAEHEALLENYKEDIRQLEEKLKNAREKERMLVQRHIHAVRKKRAQEEMRRMDGADAIFKFEEMEHRIEHMEAEADLVNFGRKPILEDELERLALDDEIEIELKALKASSIDQMEKRVEALETIVGDNKKGGDNYEQL